MLKKLTTLEQRTGILGPTVAGGQGDCGSICKSYCAGDFNAYTEQGAMVMFVMI